jgi:hypothetical protein
LAGRPEWRPRTGHGAPRQACWPALRIDGMVERELEIGFGQLLRMPLTEADITLV